MYLGIDIGTQSLKAIVVDDALRLCGTGSSPYQPRYPRPGWAEQDPALWLVGAPPRDRRGAGGCRRRGR